MEVNFPETAKALHKYIANLLGSLYEEKEAFNISSALLFDLLRLQHSDILMDKKLMVSANNSKLLQDAIDRLQKHEPIQYVTGKSHFMDLELFVDRNVLIPRPETEELVSHVLRLAPYAQKILDVGTGSGCIAIALAKKLANAKVVAMDVDKNALAVAEKNAASNQTRIDFRELDILSVKTLEESFDTIVSNPPYIPASDKVHMEKNVLEYEPENALFVPDPFLFYSKISAIALCSLAKNGHLFFEIHEKMGDDIKSMLLTLGFENVIVHKDMQGKDRVVHAQLINVPSQ